MVMGKENLSKKSLLFVFAEDFAISKNHYPDDGAPTAQHENPS